MALAGRSTRRRGAGSRWLVIGIVITLLVLFIDAAMQSRSTGPGQQLSDGAWIDRVLPVIATSTQEGEQVAGIWTGGLQTSAPTLTAQLTATANGASHAYTQVVNARPPLNLAGAAGLLEACLLARSEAATALLDSIRPVLTGARPDTPSTSDPSVAGIQTVGDDLQVGDRAYGLFVRSLPKLGVTMPPSQWATDSTPYQPDSAVVWLTSLQNAMSSTPVHELKIYSIATSPAAVSTQGSIEVLPDSSAMAVTVVVADVGNQSEKGLTVTASIAPSHGTSSVRDFEDLSPGQAHSIIGMGPLNPPQGVPVTLTISVTPGAGSATTAVSQTLVFEMPAPPPATTTTTTSTSTTTKSSG